MYVHISMDGIYIYIIYIIQWNILSICHQQYLDSSYSTRGVATIVRLMNGNDLKISKIIMKSLKTSGWKGVP